MKKMSKTIFWYDLIMNLHKIKA